MHKVYPKPVNRRLELREAVEASLPCAPVVLLQPISGDLLRVCERQPLRPVIHALALGPSRLAQSALQVVELGVSRWGAERLDIVSHRWHRTFLLRRSVVQGDGSVSGFALGVHSNLSASGKPASSR